MKLLAVYGCLVLTFATVNAQLLVKIVDDANSLPVEGAMMYLTDEAGKVLAQVISDESGSGSFITSRFPINLMVSHLAYEPYSLKLNKAEDITIRLSANTTTLQDLVITGQYEPQSAKRSVYQVRSISSERIQSRAATRLQDVLNTELNIQFSQDLATGGSNISLQGLSGQNVKVLIDGVPMVGRQGTGNEININQINVNNIQRIEIVEGPMSVMFGADALAGVINIITKKPDEGTHNITVRLHEESVGNEYGINEGIHNQSISLAYKQKSFYTLFDFMHNNFNGWQGDAEDRDKEWHPKRQFFASALLGYNEKNTDVYYRLDALSENIYNPGLFSGIEALDQRYITNRLMHQVQLSTQLADAISYNTSLAYTDYRRRIQSTTINLITGDERLALGQGLQEEITFDGVNLRGTFQIKANDKISIQPGYDINYERGSGGRIVANAEGIFDYAAFVSAEWKPDNRISIRPGLRFLANSVYDAPPVTPSINTKFSLTENHDLRFSYGRGFRAPSIRELYFNFFDASHSIEGNPDLKAEMSHSLNTSWNAYAQLNSKIKFNSSLSAFYNDVENMIGFGVKPGNANITTYLNIEKFRSQGINWLGQLNHQQFNASLGAAWIGRQNQLHADREDLPSFFWSPEVNGSLMYRLEKWNANASLFYKFTGPAQFYQVDPFVPEENPELAEIDGFHWADLTLQKSILKHYNFTIGIRNLFNVIRINNSAADVGSVHGTGGARPVGYGRSYFATLTITL